MTPADLSTFVDTYRRTTGRLPRLRECVDHFEGRLLNVLLCLGELPADKAAGIRLAAGDERQTRINQGRAGK